MLPNYELTGAVAPYQFKFLLVIFTIFSATWLISCIAAVKLVSIFGITLTGGFIVFPITNLVANIIVEIYGYKNARQAIWSGFILNLLFVFFIYIVSIIPASPYWPLQGAFNEILLPSIRITCASLFSFMISFFLNAYIMAEMKIKSGGASLQKRILISNILSITLDIFCFIFLAYYGVIPFTILLQLLTAAYLKKIVCELAFLPLIWFLIDRIKAHEGFEIFDDDTNFTPFSMDNVYQLNAYKRTTDNEIKLTNTI